MGDRQPILPEPCNNFCKVEQAAESAFERYAEQPSLTVAVEFPNRGTIHVSRDIGDRSTLIHDPQPVIDTVQEQLKRQPCDFLKSGQCGAAKILIESSLNVTLG